MCADNMRRGWPSLCGALQTASCGTAGQLGSHNYDHIV